MTLDPHGLPCTCGSRGCWETLASQNAVFRRVSQAIQNGASSELTGSSWTMEQVLAAARHGDDCARQALRETGVYMGIGIASLINALNPQVVVFGGILSLAHEFVLPAIRQEIERRALVWSRQAVEIKLSAHGPDSCVLGSVAAVYHRILADPVMGR
jgi:predicted NBD/HSP70 family sugar kinase